MRGVGNTAIRLLSPQRPDEVLEDAARQWFHRTFSLLGAVVVFNERHVGNHSAILILEAGNIRLRVVRDGDDVLVEAAPRCSPEDWILVSHVLRILTGDGYVSLPEIDVILTQNFELLNQAYSKEQYLLTREKLTVFSGTSARVN